ncbi:MAG: hypothetical protein F4Y02_10750 [Chloroflexi bacterium]|nr:hypothetical protein [Chloroflexota bacterium]
MKREGYDHGFPAAHWPAAKEEARQAMSARARRRKLITYSELVAAIQALDLEPQSPQLAHMLGETSTDEHAAGGGMLSVVVVHKAGEQMPGSGFFELAQSFGHDTRDRVAFWVGELAKVHGTWA